MIERSRGARARSASPALDLDLAFDLDFAFDLAFDLGHEPLQERGTPGRISPRPSEGVSRVILPGGPNPAHMDFDFNFDLGFDFDLDFDLREPTPEES